MIKYRSDCVEIYCVNISKNTKADYESFKKIVSTERRAKAEKYRLYYDSVRSVYAEVLLKYALKLKCEKKSIYNIAYNEYGKPYLQGENKFFFNISHSGDWAIIAFGSSQVGVDIEKIDVNNISYLADAFTEDEKTYVNTQDKAQQIKNIFRLWTLKESYVKYLGTGMFTDLADFTVDLSIGKVRNTSDGAVIKGIHFNSAIIDTEYYLSVCSADEKVCVKEIELDELKNVLL